MGYPEFLRFFQGFQKNPVLFCVCGNPAYGYFSLQITKITIEKNLAKIKYINQY